MTARLSTLVPLALIGLLIIVVIGYRPFDFLVQNTPPIEDLAIEQVELDNDGIHIYARASGSLPIDVAQIQVDGAYWVFQQTPAGPLSHLASARFDIPYAWVAGEAHHLTFVTSSGASFDHEIAVAVPKLRYGTNEILAIIAAGLLVGMIPILIGYCFMPLIASFGRAGLDFALAMTIGLLGFLLIDMILEGLEISERALGAFDAPLAFWLSAVLGFVLLTAAGRRPGGRPSGGRLAGFIALGIGLHNLGEGLAIGAALTVGEVALASFLLLGFALHNVTEGVAIATPVTDRRRHIPLLIALAALAGLPALFGIWIGSYAFSPFWVTIALGFGVGAIFQVIMEVFALLSDDDAGVRWLKPAAIGGFTLAILIMWISGVYMQA